MDPLELGPRHRSRAGRNPDGSWDPLDAQGRPLIPVPTPETKVAALRSVYAINKYVQERLTLTLTEQYGMEGVALRLWNIYGPGQALSNSRVRCVPHEMDQGLGQGSLRSAPAKPTLSAA